LPLKRDKKNVNLKYCSWKLLFFEIKESHLDFSQNLSLVKPKFSVFSVNLKDLFVLMQWRGTQGKHSNFFLLNYNASFILFSTIALKLKNNNEKGEIALA
jgi:hypothetical protein